MKERNAKGHRVLRKAAMVKSENPAETKKADQSRRRFVKFNLLGLALAPTASLVLSENAWAVKRHDDEPALIDLEDPQAKAIKYMVPSPKNQQDCSNCQLYTGTEGAASGPCALFSYRIDTQSGKPLWVHADGWCRAWAPRQV